MGGRGGLLRDCGGKDRMAAAFCHGSNFFLKEGRRESVKLSGRGGKCE